MNAVNASYGFLKQINFLLAKIIEVFLQSSFYHEHLLKKLFNSDSIKNNVEYSYAINYIAVINNY